MDLSYRLCLTTAEYHAVGDLTERRVEEDKERGRERYQAKNYLDKKKSERKNEDVKSERGRERCDEYQPGR